MPRWEPTFYRSPTFTEKLRAEPIRYVAGAILEGDTLYLLLTDILKADGHTTSALVGFTLAGTPNNRTLTILAENPVDELPIADELTSGILPLEADELFIARDTAAYRLSPPIVSDIDAEHVTIDTSNFNGKLASTDDTLQKVADKVDDFVFSAGMGGNPEWTDVQSRPNRPSAAELLAGHQHRRGRSIRVGRCGFGEQPQARSV